MKKEVLARYLLQKQRCLTPPGDETLEIGGGKRRLAHPKKNYSAHRRWVRVEIEGKNAAYMLGGKELREAQSRVNVWQKC